MSESNPDSTHVGQPLKGAGESGKDDRPTQLDPFEQQEAEDAAIQREWAERFAARKGNGQVNRNPHDNSEQTVHAAGEFQALQLSPVEQQEAKDAAIQREWAEQYAARKAQARQPTPNPATRPPLNEQPPASDRRDD